MEKSNISNKNNDSDDFIFKDYLTGVIFLNNNLPNKRFILSRLKNNLHGSVKIYVNYINKKESAINRIERGESNYYFEQDNVSPFTPSNNCSCDDILDLSDKYEKEGYSFSQIGQLIGLISDGIDAKDLENKKYNWAQMEILRLSKYDGVDTSKLLNPSMSQLIMFILERAMVLGIDISKTELDKIDFNSLEIDVESLVTNSEYINSIIYDIDIKEIENNLSIDSYIEAEIDKLDESKKKSILHVEKTKARAYTEIVNCIYKETFKRYKSIKYK